MLADAAGKILAKILVDLLQYLQSREDLKDAVRSEIEIAGFKDANEALGWKASAVGSADGGATLTVKEGAIEIKIPGVPPKEGPPA